MDEHDIAFVSEGISFLLANPTKISTWLQDVIRSENYIFSTLTYIFCDDEYLYNINVEHLQHDTYTDVITFQYSEHAVDGDIFISIDRIKENAVNFAVTTEHELHRVMVHGLLHLMGYKDKTQADKALMTQKEDFYLAMLNQRDTN